MTTRRYPRSLLEAWPHHYPHSIEHHKRPLAERVADWMTAAALAAFILGGMLYGLGAL